MTATRELEVLILTIVMCSLSGAIASAQAVPSLSQLASTALPLGRICFKMWGMC
ncbi:hypothetical protein [Scytonema sp. UIC 10036]|uniref:hypothetical protein n=1 Tax=Scytonema sp. UIC 10036 TaxID=2304196 RepID=UPI001A9B5FCC|nr:hypothetical protein [Scytonema sp. UIC 10036]